RDVRRSLVHLALREREGGREEGVARLVRRQVREVLVRTADGAGVLAAVEVDEAGLADAVGEQQLQVGEGRARRRDHRPARLQLLAARARQRVELREGRV